MCVTRVAESVCIQGFDGKARSKMTNKSEDLRVDEMIVLKWILDILGV